MRIDDLGRANPSPEAAKTNADGLDRAKAGGSSALDADSDAASISPLASSALHAALDTKSDKTNDARLEALRLQVERGEFHVSAEEVAASIIDQHIVER